MTSGAGPADRSSRPSLPRRAALRRLNVVVATLLVVAGIVAVPFWRPVDPGLGAPAGRRVGARHPGSRPRCAVWLARVIACSTRSSGARGSSSPCPTCRVALDSRIELIPAAAWDAAAAIEAGSDDWQAQLDGVEGDDRGGQGR